MKVICYDENPEYKRTNIEGTCIVLEEARKLDVKRFIFASSVAACEFPREGDSRIDEKTPADAPFSCAVSKRVGKRPFERPWMIRYLDKQMLVDNSYTREKLRCYPTRRFVIHRRLIYMRSI